MKNVYDDVIKLIKINESLRLDQKMPGISQNFEVEKEKLIANWWDKWRFGSMEGSYGGEHPHHTQLALE